MKPVCAQRFAALDFSRAAAPFPSLRPAAMNPPQDEVKVKKGSSIATFVAKQKANIIIYTSLAVLLLWAWHFVSDGDFSFLMVRAPRAHCCRLPRPPPATACPASRAVCYFCQLMRCVGGRRRWAPCSCSSHSAFW